MKIRKYLTNEKVSLFDSDVEYLIKDSKTKNSYILTSWTTGKQPKNIYTVTQQKNKWVCNCPVRSNSCKHIKMVKDWIKDGKPSIVDPDVEDDIRQMLRKKGVQIEN